MMRLHKIFLTLVCLTALSAHAQWKWLNPLECGFPVIQNQGWTEEIGDSYVRLPQRAEGKVRKPVWDLSRNSAGLAIHFFSNAPELKVRYQVSGPLNMPHMPTTGVSGVDLIVSIAMANGDFISAVILPEIRFNIIIRT